MTEAAVALVRGQFLRLLLHAWLRPANKGLVRLGSAYGGWWVPRLAVTEGGVAYCAGAGEDVTFDLALHAAGFRVRTFDPTPRAIAHVESVRPHDARFVFVPIGWWESEATLRFYAPRNADHVSHSALNLQETDEYFEAEVKTVAAHARDIGDSQIDLIKMDVEGAETRVIRSLLEDGPLPRVLCVEFDQPQPFAAVVGAIRALRSSGYRVAKIERWDFTFVRSDPAVLSEVA